ncbi:MAG: KEOPS complex N(6)-L-threonylcarbamoyladenine synthase Kae1 [Candidatus Micrarchaeaceae archaeon]
MPVLGIESSAHTLGVGVVDNGKVLSNEKAMYNIRDGIIPMRVADFHAKNSAALLKRALRKANISIDGIEAIGYTKGPGLGPCLRVGQVMAKTLALSYGIPLYPVNHAVAHIEITKHLAMFDDPLALYVSGGNSQILAISDEPYRHYHIYGETFDIGVGNMLDSFARAAGLKPPWGSTVEKEALGGNYIEMPYTVKGMDFAFTGLLTNAIGALKSSSLNDIAFSLQETAFSMLCEATERALLLTGKKELVMSGGVAQSARLKKMLGIVAASHRAKFYVAPNEFNGDNGAMIALVAEKMHMSGARYKPKDCTIEQKYRIDRVRLA